MQEAPDSAIIGVIKPSKKWIPTLVGMPVIDFKVHFCVSSVNNILRAQCHVHISFTNHCYKES